MSIVNSTIEHVAATVVHVGSAAWRKSGDEVDSQRSFHTGNQCDRTPVHLFPHLDASTAEQRDVQCRCQPICLRRRGQLLGARGRRLESSSLASWTVRAVSACTTTRH